MAYEQKDMSGSLFKNDRREKDTHPHAKGTALIDGVEYWVDAWTNETRDGSKYQSLKFKKKETAEPRAKQRWTAEETRVASFDEDEGSAPF